jgi:hypothetical protein
VYRELAHLTKFCGVRTQNAPIRAADHRFSARLRGAVDWLKATAPLERRVA